MADGPRNRRHRQTFLDRGLNELVAGIGDERRARIGNQCQRLSLADAVDHAVAHRIVRVLVIGHQRRRDAVMGEQGLRTRVSSASTASEAASMLSAAKGDVLRLPMGVATT